MSVSIYVDDAMRWTREYTSHGVFPPQAQCLFPFSIPPPFEDELIVLIPFSHIRTDNTGWSFAGKINTVKTFLEKIMSSQEASAVQSRDTCSYLRVIRRRRWREWVKLKCSAEWGNLSNKQRASLGIYEVWSSSYFCTGRLQQDRRYTVHSPVQSRRKSIHHRARKRRGNPVYGSR